MLGPRAAARVAKGTPAGPQEILRPLVSLRSKSEKARRKLAPGTWQHALLQGNVAALRIACTLLADPGPPNRFGREELQDALRSLGTMIDRTEAALATFARGTSQHTLQSNRLRALAAAQAAVKATSRKADA